MSKLSDTASNYIQEVRIAAELGNEATPLIDEQFLAMGRVALRTSPSPFFSLIGSESLAGPERPESVDHHRTLLQPNAISTSEIDGALGLVDLMLGEQAQELTAQFQEYASRHDIFERVQTGEKFIVVSNHLELPDQGFTMGLWQKAAREVGLDRLENHLTVVVGRLIGYYQLGDTNVLDGILRKAGSVLKTFPSGGSEAMPEHEQVLRLFRRICNHRTKEAFEELISSPEGRIICMAPSGAQDRLKAAEGLVQMSEFGKGTTEMIAHASQHGATIVPIFVDYAPDRSIAVLLPPVPSGDVQTTDHCHDLGRAIARSGTFARGQAYQARPDIERFQHPVAYGA